jgi:hypothetical protein
VARLFTAASTEFGEYAGAPLSAYPWTLSIWFYTGAAANATLFGLHRSASSDEISLQTRSTGVIRGGVTNGGTTNNVETTATLSANTWHLATFIGRSSTDRSIYLDGANRVNTVTAKTMSASLGLTTIGRRSGSTPGSYHNGRLAEVAIWNVGLDDDEL